MYNCKLKNLKISADIIATFHCIAMSLKNKKLAME